MKREDNTERERERDHIRRTQCSVCLLAELESDTNTAQRVLRVRVGPYVAVLDHRIASLRRARDVHCVAKGVIVVVLVPVPAHIEEGRARYEHVADARAVNAVAVDVLKVTVAHSERAESVSDQRAGDLQLLVIFLLELNGDTGGIKGEVKNLHAALTGKVQEAGPNMKAEGQSRVDRFDQI